MTPEVLRRWSAEKVMGWFEQCDDDTQQYMWMRENPIDGEDDFVMFQKLWLPNPCLAILKAAYAAIEQCTPR